MKTSVEQETLLDSGPCRPGLKVRKPPEPLLSKNTGKLKPSKTCPDVLQELLTVTVIDQVNEA